jgi:hypothetical protein
MRRTSNRAIISRTNTVTMIVFCDIHLDSPNSFVKKPRCAQRPLKSSRYLSVPSKAEKTAHGGDCKIADMTTLEFLNGSLRIVITMSVNIVGAIGMDWPEFGFGISGTI